MRRPLAFVLLPLLLAAPLVRSEVPFNDGWRTRLLVRTELPPAANALMRWRPLLPLLFPEDPLIGQILTDELSPLSAPPAEPARLSSWLNGLGPSLIALRLRPGESLQPLPLHGPETAFPDHQPLRQLAVVRNAAVKAAWRDHRSKDALALALDNLALARTLLATQEGIVPAIHATSVWEIALDGVYWLVRQPGLTADQASTLQADLGRDDALAVLGVQRAFRGEFTFFTRLVVDRLPRTHDPELLLNSIGSLGMTPPAAPEPGEPRLGISEHNPLDYEATLQAASDDVQDWISVITRTRRHPHAFHTPHTEARLHAYAREIPALLRYASSEAPPSTRQLAEADTEIATVANPIGKLFLVITTSQWAPISAHVFKREAERRALIGLLAMRRFGRPAAWEELVAAGLLTAPPDDPFGEGPLRCDPTNRPRIWSVGANGTDEGGTGDGDNTGRPPDLTWPSG